jgi:hypothetical protein
MQAHSPFSTHTHVITALPPRPPMKTPDELDTRLDSSRVSKRWIIAIGRGLNFTSTAGTTFKRQ